MASPALVPVVRGDVPLRSAMEVLQIGYLYAVAAAAGCSLSSPFPDRGIDWTVNHASSQHLNDPEASIKVALKSTSQVTAPLAGATFSFELKNEHLAKLSVPAPTLNRLLIVMVVPKQMRHWVLATGNYMQLRHCAYWANLTGHGSAGAKTTTVHIRRDHVFDDVALCEIMQIVGQGGVPS